MAMIEDDATLRRILAESRRVAMVGLSPDPGRASHQVARHLIEFGYDVIPVNPKITHVLGRKAVADLKDITSDIDLVDVFRSPEHVPAIVEACIDKHIRTLWLQEDVINHQAAQRASEHGIQVVMDRCMFKEYNRLSL